MPLLISPVKLSSSRTAASLFCHTLLSLTVIGVVLASSFHLLTWSDVTVQQTYTAHYGVLKEFSPRAFAGPRLRIMPLGDSITWGSLSSSGNGWRGPLQQLLLASGGRAGGEVDFVGSRQHGTMTDSDNEGHSGSFLSEILKYSKLSINAEPNVVLLHAGTNDMDLDRDVETAIDRLEAIVRAVISGSSETTVLVARIIMSTDANMQSRSNAYNDQISSLIKSLRDKDLKVVEVDMSSILTTADLADKKHPNDGGYAKMAQAWSRGIDEARSLGFISDPQSPKTTSGVGVGLGGTGGGGGGGSCESSNWRKAGEIANLVKNYREVGVIASGAQNATADNVRFADIDGDGFDDYLVVLENGSVNAYLNQRQIPDKSGTKWKNIGTIAAGAGPDTGRQVRLADVDGDGLADYLLVYDDGAALWWRNTGNLNKEQQKFNFDANVTLFDGVGEPGSKVLIEDVDGDGRADYLVLYDGGAVKAWQNTKDGMKELGTIAPGVAGVDGSRVRIQDYDGDGNADYLVLWRSGAVDAYLNHLNEDRDRVWEDIGTVAAGVSGVTGGAVRFADVNGDGRLDYLAISATGEVRAWIQIGGIRRGDGVRFTDLNGDGRDDFLWISEDGEVQAWLNGGLGDNEWESVGTIAKLAGVPRSKIQFADVDGDLSSDFLVVYDGGAVRAYRNNGALGGGTGPSFDDIGIIASGVGQPGSKVRFADVDGDGFADYIILFDGGAAEAYINQHNVLNDQRKFEKLSRTFAGGVNGVKSDDVIFADLNGDRWADYLVSYDAGAVDAYINTHNLGAGSGKRNFDSWGRVAAGVTPQGVVYLADVDGDGKADYLSVDPMTGAVTAYINVCAGDNPSTPAPDSGDSGGDSGDGDGEDDDPIDTTPIPSCDNKYHDIDALSADIADMPEHCVNVYLMTILRSDLTEALSSYNKLLDTGYDKKFEEYAQYVIALIQPQINEYMYDHSNDYFTCSKQEKCCSACTSAFGCSGEDGCVRADNCDEDGLAWVDQNCPGAAPQTPSNSDYEEWRYKCNDKDGFLKVLSDEYGIAPDWVTFGDVRVGITGGCGTNGQVTESCYTYWHSYPVQAKDPQVPDPKEGIAAAETNYTTLGKQLDGAIFNALRGALAYDEVDVVDGSSIPVYMTVESVAAMQKVIDTAEKVEEEEKKNLILGFIMAILFIIPVVGEAAGALGLTTIARIISFVAAAGDSAFALYGVVEDPASAIFLIFGALAVRDFAKAGKTRRGLSKEDIGAVGTTIANKLGALDKVKRSCR